MAPDACPLTPGDMVEVQTDATLVLGIVIGTEGRNVTWRPIVGGPDQTAFRRHCVWVPSPAEIEKVCENELQPTWDAHAISRRLTQKVEPLEVPRA